ncbi:hypothetical protein [Budvicia aquatica]|uniref:Uncharacterized protein n=1 Tax=Budvicia aquatica TaxID=82979 RepID=A0A2C6DMN0_9GAMM|nr:hypothetical protein [Budvicia aquatica]PHI30061.1 hypothetical protein CRN84_12270 [Budvicia aquatica]VFS49048.1 Uncharacterised protein [Budvicia aquatica]
MVVKSETISQAWHTLLTEINQDVDYHRVKVQGLNRIDRGCVVMLLLFLMACGGWGWRYGLGLGLLAVFFAVPAGALIVAHRLSRQVQAHTRSLDQLIPLQTWATGTLMTADNLTYLTQARQRIRAGECPLPSNQPRNDP